MAEGRRSNGMDSGSVDDITGTNFSVSISKSDNVIVGNNCKMVVCTQSKSKRRCKKEKITPKYPQTSSQEPLTTKQKLDLKGKVGKPWKDLGTRLGFDNSELEQMKIDYRDDVSELIYQILTKWQQRNAELATRAFLAKVFMKMKRGDLADILADVS